jgi:diaminopimelate epimerase
VVYDPALDGIGFSIYNRDGSRAEISGNGMAGLGALLFYQGAFSSRIRIHTAVGPRSVQLVERQSERRFRLQVEIGTPDFSPRPHFPFLKPGMTVYRWKEWVLHPVAVGNPHAVIILDEYPGAGALDALGDEISRLDIFPDGVNVEFVRDIRDNRCRIHFFERGAGRTPLSSTGSAAVFAVLDRGKKITGPLTLTGLKPPVCIFRKKSIYIENTTEILYKCKRP